MRVAGRVHVALRAVELRRHIELAHEVGGHEVARLPRLHLRVARLRQQIDLEGVRHRFVEQHRRGVGRQDQGLPAGSGRDGEAGAKARRKARREAVHRLGVELRREQPATPPGQIGDGARIALALRLAHQTRPHDLHPARMLAHREPQRKRHVLGAERALHGAWKLAPGSVVLLPDGGLGHRGLDERRARLGASHLARRLDERLRREAVAARLPDPSAAHQAHGKPGVRQHARRQGLVGRWKGALIAMLEERLDPVFRLVRDLRQQARDRAGFERSFGHGVIFPRRCDLRPAANVAARPGLVIHNAGERPGREAERDGGAVPDVRAPRADARRSPRRRC